MYLPFPLTIQIRNNKNIIKFEYRRILFTLF